MAEGILGSCDDNLATMTMLGAYGTMPLMVNL